ncbi:MAG: S8 family serine peptidase [Deltaproteobacteria bacterium]|nr:S8 family serine peptidase [Deltaproteobacteria bacterium]
MRRFEALVAFAAWSMVVHVSVAQAAGSSATVAVAGASVAGRAIRTPSRFFWGRVMWRHGEKVPFVQNGTRLALPGSSRRVAHALEQNLPAGIRAMEVVEIVPHGVCLVRLGPVDRLPTNEAGWRALAGTIVTKGRFAWAGPVFFDAEATELPTGNLWVFFGPKVDRTMAASKLSGVGLRLVGWIKGVSPIAVATTVKPTADLFEFATQLWLGHGLDVVPELMQRFYPRMTPTDTYYSRQWTMNNTGNNVTSPLSGQPIAGLAGADIRAEGAWDETTGDASTIVGVIDTGVDCTHPELADKCLSPLNAITNVPDASPPDPSTDRGSGHGTSVASITSAPMDGVGVVGVCPECTVVPVRLIEQNTYLTDAIMLRAYTHVVDAGAVVINNSWGPQAVGFFIPVSTGEQQGMAYALNNGRGGLGTVVVYAAGNDNQSTDFYGHLQTGLANVMAVAASDQFDAKAEYSNYGPDINVSAPSSDGYVDPAVYAAEIRGNGNVVNDYTSQFGGTSGAAPMVSGVVALVLTVAPNLTAAEAVQLIEDTADKIDPDGGRYDGNGYSIKYGFGRVNALRAVLSAEGQNDRPWCDSPAATEDCDQHRDDNCDDMVNEGCNPLGNVGMACSIAGDCGPQMNWSCPTTGKQKGLCTVPCTNTNCPGGSACVNGYCSKECASNTECPDDFVCTNDQLGICLPACTGDSDCGTGEHCDMTTHLCKLTTDGKIGSPCIESADCLNGTGFCLGSMMGFTNGYCTTSCNNDMDCGGDSNRCVLITEHGKFCYAGCSMDGDCRPSYVCEQSGPRKGTCYKHCDKDEQCTGGDPNWDGIVCELSSGRCIDEREPDAGVDAAVDGSVVDASGNLDGTVTNDASVGDGGSNVQGGGGGGCNCRASGMPAPGSFIFLLGLIGLLGWRRRGSNR